MNDYQLNIPGLGALIESVAPGQQRNTASHATLLGVVRGVPGLEKAEIAKIQEGWSLKRRRVFSAQDELVHDNHEVWLAQEFVNDGASAQVTHKRLLTLGLRLSRTSITQIVLTLDRGGPESNFLQLEIEMHSERLDCGLFGKWDSPRNVGDLLHEVEGERLPERQQKPIGVPSYKLIRVIDIEKFLKLILALDGENRERIKKMMISASDGLTKPRTIGYREIDPDFEKYPHKAARLFQDWASSSAGESGARLCAHWVMKTSDGAIPGMRLREATLIPMWTTGRKLPEVTPSKGTPQELLRKLQTIDEKTGVPFAWFFFMLHGNRVTDGAGYRILKAIEAGEIALPERDHLVLRRWNERNYGF